MMKILLFTVQYFTIIMMYLFYTQLKIVLQQYHFLHSLQDCNDVLALAAVNAVPYEPAKGPGYLMWTTDGTYTMNGRSENHIYVSDINIL